MPDNQAVSHSQSLIRKIIFIFLALVQSRLNNFLFKTCKISEQQINCKVLSVASSCHYNGNSKNGKNRYGQMPAPRELIPTNPSRAKARMQKPQGGGKFWVQIPGGVGMVMDEIDTCISTTRG